MIGLQTPRGGEPWRVLGNIADEIVARLEEPHSRQVERACEGKRPLGLRFPGGEAERRLPRTGSTNAVRLAGA